MEGRKGGWKEGSKGEWRALAGDPQEHTQDGSWNERGRRKKRGHVGYSGRSNAHPIGFSERDDTENRKEVIC